MDRILSKNSACGRLGPTPLTGEAKVTYIWILRGKETPAPSSKSTKPCRASSKSPFSKH